MDYRPLKLSRYALLVNFFSEQAERYLERAARRHVRDGCPPMAVFAFDHIGHKIAARGVYEREHLDAVMKYLADEKKIVGAALDIGANIGNHAVYFARYFENVVCFEAHPVTYQLLKFNVRDCSNVVCHQVGVSDQPGQGFIDVINPANVGMSQVSRGDAGGARERHPITLSPVDGVYDTVGRVGLIKMDVEGHEADVLRGCAQLIKRDKPVILFEQGQREFADGTSKTIELLRQFGYRDFRSIDFVAAFDFGLGASLNRTAQAILSVIFGPRIAISRQTVFPRRRYTMLMALAD